MISLDTYQKIIKDFAIYPKADTHSQAEAMYLALGLTGETGEIAEKIKKFYRDGTINSEALAKELGDVFWYLCRLCSWVGLPATEILQRNIDKLTSRKQRNVLGGSGDER